MCRVYKQYTILREYALKKFLLANGESLEAIVHLKNKCFIIDYQDH